MFDFLEFEVTVKSGKAEIKPDFSTIHHEDLLIRGGDFYAVWIEERGLWSTNETDVITIVDRELWKYAEENKSKWLSYKVYEMGKASSKMLDRWHKYCQKDLRDNYPVVSLDRYLTFSNTEITKKDYVSKRLPYALKKGDISAYDKLMTKLYAPEERKKLEWAIGSVVAKESEFVQKFIVIYGEPGKGKSTVLKLIEQMFDGYCGSFDAQTLGMASKDFAMEPFKDNPLVAMDHEAKLDRIESNRNLNNIVSHERVPMNTKFHSVFRMKIRTFLFIAANDPVKITSANSGLMRRMIDVYPTGNTFPENEYDDLWEKTKYEYGAIAWHCKEVYESDRKAYSRYKPINMMVASNDFYNFMLYNYMIFDEQDGVSQKSAWEMYGTYCDMANTPKTTYTKFQEEIKAYFETIEDRHKNEDGTRTRTYYSGFKRDRFKSESGPKQKPKQDGWINFSKISSLFDIQYAECPAQYGDDNVSPPIKPWAKVKTKLKDLDTSQLHYVRVPINHIVIDFDIPDENGNKCLEKNLQEANKWPKTYAELSKSGQGIHLHYIYTGDPEQLSRNFDNKIEVKVFSGLSSLRRKLSLCNDIPIAEISSGLPLKEERKMISDVTISDSKHLEAIIVKLLKRNEKTKNNTASLDEILHTKQCISLIDSDLNAAYDSGMHYDMRRLYGRVMKCAMSSTNNKEYCITKVANMKFRSDDIPEGSTDEGMPIVFYDVEVFPNLFVLNWKFRGKDEPVYSMINPDPEEVVDLMKFRLIGFNCRRYDNHIIFAWGFLHYNNLQLYNLSQSIILNGKGFFGEAYNISWTDIYDFASTKQSLKKWEIQFKIHHKELGMRWDQPVPEEKWGLVAEYCNNDVIATEECFERLQADFIGRQTLAELAGGTVNDTTNSLTAKLIFGNNRRPQSSFNYRNLALPVGSDQYAEYRRKFGEERKFRVFNSEGLPEYRDYEGETLPDGWSILPFFPGYTHENGVSMFMGEKIGEGGKVYAEQGIWPKVWDGDAASMHPTSANEECAFGPDNTPRFYNLVRIRLAIKHKDYDFVRSIDGGKLAKYLENDETAKRLAYALKIAINAVYGQTSASYDNPFLDIRNKDNFIAKRGALFMTVLKSEVQKRGFTVCHIKTDSIKIPNATQEIKDFVIKFAKEYGYMFETEDEFEKMCLVNDAVYVAKRTNGEWTATGTQFKVPYVFKTLFSKEPIDFYDLCETKQVSVGMMYLDMNEGLPEGDHNRVFVGRIGQFCPIKPGCKGGELVKELEKDGEIKYDAVTGCKGYRWLESETVIERGKQDDIDISYYRRFVDKAIEAISKYGDFEAFAS